MRAKVAIGVESLYSRELGVGTQADSSPVERGPSTATGSEATRRLSANSQPRTAVGVVHTGVTEMVALGIYLPIEGCASTEIVVVVLIHGRSADREAVALPSDVRSASMAPYRATLCELALRAVQPRRGNSPDGVVGTHRGIELAHGSKSSETPSTAEPELHSAATHERDLIGRTMWAQSGS